MALLKKIFDFFYHSKPSLALRESAAKRIDRRLAPILSRLDALEEHFTGQIQQSNNASVQRNNELSNKLTNELTNIHRQLDDRIVRAIQVSQLSDWRLKVLTERQNAIAQINSFDSMLADFEKVMEIIFANETAYTPTNNQRYDHDRMRMILLDLISAYMFEGGIWQLRQEITDFLAIERPDSSQLQGTSLELPPASGNKPLKILVISGLFPAIEHGGGLRLFDILQGLSGEHEIDLYSVYDEETDKHSLKLLQDGLSDIHLIESEEIVDHQTTRDNICTWLREIGKDQHYYDIIQLEYPHTIYLTNFMKQYGQKVGFTFMECLTKSNVIKILEMFSSNNLSEMSKFVTNFWQYAVSEKFALQNADFLIAVTPEDADFLQKLYPRQPFIVPTCLSQIEIIDKLPENNAEPEDNCVAFLGFFGHYPNIDSMKWYLSEIHPLIKTKIPAYKFLIIGAGDTSELREMAQNDTSVEFTGRVDDVTPHIQRAAVCTLPLITGAGIRGKLNQYSICGRPSVSTNIGNKGLNYEHDVSVMISDTAPDFAEAIIELLSDDNKRKSMAENARSYAKDNFTWDTHLQTLTRIYRSASS